MDRMREFGEQGFNAGKHIGGAGLHVGLSTAGDFKKFILRGNVVDLAVGVVIGTAFNSVVQAFVKDVITPLIPGGEKGFGNWTTTIPYTHATLNTGDFANTIISFLIIAAVVFFFVVKPINALEATYGRLRPKPAAVPITRDCPYCLSTVPLKATRCAHCTSPLPPVDAPIPPAQ